MSDSRFLTQVPLQTQVSTTAFDIDTDNLSQTQYNSASKEDDESRLPISAQHAQPSSSPPPNEVRRAAVLTTREVPNSSEESIECQPFVLPATNPNINLTQAESQAETQSHVDLQPFPLVDWIKKIRSDTPRRWPTFPLRWARTISKEQQAILDQDDAWSPPLAGRPVRPGTVPIRLLNLFTEKADAEARKAQENLHCTERISGSVSAQQSSSVSKSMPEVVNKAIPVSGDDDEDDESEVATQHASQWDSSPPQPQRRLAPPDTSPIRESTFNHPSAIHVGTEPRLMHDDAASDVAEEPQQPLSALDNERILEDNNHATSNSHQRSVQPDDTDHISQRMTNLQTRQSVTRERRRTDQTNDAGNRSKEQSKKTPPKVQVKDTPFPKPALKARQSRIAEDIDLPQSSFVGATYPLISPKNILNQDNREMDIDQIGTSSVTRSQRTARSQRMQAKPDQIAMQKSTLEAELPVLPSHQRREEDIEREQPPRKRIRLSPAKEATTDSDYKEMDAKRVLARRAFRQSIPADSRPRLVSRESSVRVTDKQRSVSRTSSPQHTDKRSHAMVSESGRTAATNFSMHRLNTYEPAVPRHASVQSSFNPRAIEILLSRYQSAYPAYQGDEKAFTSAIRLIISLRSQPREPHPSLWDDFVFRKSDDYRSHLQYCIDEGENALPYQDFYYTNVRRPERQQDIISEDTLVALHNEPHEGTQTGSVQIHGKSASPRNNVPAEKLLIENFDLSQHDMSMLDAPKDDSQTHLDHRADLLIEEQPIEIPASEMRKKSRRTLPWPISQYIQGSTSPRTTMTEVITTAPRSSASEKVEEWLNSSGDTVEEPHKPPDLPLPLPILPVNAVSSEVISLQRNDERLARASEHVDSVDGVSSDAPFKTPAKVRKNSIVTSESDMSRFARLYASLQSERYANSSSNEGRIPINVYTW